MILTDVKNGTFCLRFYGDDAELLARACTVAGKSGDGFIPEYHVLATLFTFAALACQLYGQTPGGAHEDTAAGDLLARIHEGEEEDTTA